MPAKSFDGRSLLGISYVALQAVDVEASVAFHRDFLGFAEQGRLNIGDGTLMPVFISISDERSIEIFDAARVKPGSDKICQIAFRVDDAEALRAHLAQKGFEVPSHWPKPDIFGTESRGNSAARRWSRTLRVPDGRVSTVHIVSTDRCAFSSCGRSKVPVFSIRARAVLRKARPISGSNWVPMLFSISCIASSQSRPSR